MKAILACFSGLSMGIGFLFVVLLDMPYFGIMLGLLSIWLMMLSETYFD